MSIDLADILNDAELNAAPYAHENSVFRGPMLKQLSVLDKEVADIFLLTNPDRISLAGTNLTVVTATNLTGYSLAVAKSYRGFTYVDSDDLPTPIYIVVSEKEYDDPPVHPAGIVRGSKFYPCDYLGLRWVGSDERLFFKADGDKITYRYVPEPPVYTAISGCLYAPNEAYPYLLASLTLGILLRAGAPQGVLAAQFAAREEAKRSLYLTATKRTGVS
ncbi:MAG: hypothetical protein A2Y38_18945 [Spirochaetes bacterium GWB1_59_5]|nr:MAG: hypothetical protein A2Y38_18945 [Spirochaetes bacterium GWB1_59_5]